MKTFDDLVSEIRLRANLSHQEATGFYSIHCPICQKEERKTGGFKFDPEAIIYNCFRGSCDASCVFTKGEYVSKKFRNLMDALHIKIPVNFLLTKSSLKSKIEKLNENLYKKHFYKEIEVPEEFIPIEESTKGYAKNWIEYFEERCTPIDDVYVAESGKYRGHPVVAMYYYDKLVGFQVILDDKYINLSGGNTNILYIPQKAPTSPVLLVEGLFDAKCIPNGIATLGPDISPEQAYFLRDKRVICVPDRKGNKFIDQYHHYGWEFCVPPWEEKDVNSAVQRYGVMVVARKILEGVVKSKLDAEIKYKRWKI